MRIKNLSQIAAGLGKWPFRVAVILGLLCPVVHAQDASAPSSRELQLEDRLRRLELRYEEMTRLNAESQDALRKEVKALRDQVRPPSAPRSEVPTAVPSQGNLVDPPANFAIPDGPSLPLPSASGGRAAVGGNLVGGDAVGGISTPRGTPREASGVGAQGTEGRTFVREFDVKPDKKPGKLTFSEGLEFGSTDDQFKLTFHNLTQVDYRAFPAVDRGNLQNQFLIPRQRWYFTGQVTKNFEFYTVINRGYGSLDLLDAFMTINISEILTNPSSGASDSPGEDNPSGAQGGGGRADPDKGKGSDSRVRLRIGRMKTPYLYEYFSIAEGDLIAPERSLYAGNLADNRQVGAMFLGELFENRIGYATGVFDGNRRSFSDTNSNVDLFFYLNTRPFLKTEIPWLQYLAIGGSANGGVESGAVQPAVFTTANDQSSAVSNATVQSVSPTFLAFNNNVMQRGLRQQWAGELAYFYKSLMILAEYGGGFQGYTTNNVTSTSLPFNGYMVQASYFLTGEQLTRRVNVVRPIRKLGYDKGRFGLGAFEIHGRYSALNLGDQVFTAGLADPNQWANRAEAVDIGLNWYWNYYTKVQLDWQHAMFNDPISTGRPGHSVGATDLFWIRFQLFF